MKSNKNISLGLSGNYRIYGGAREMVEIDDLHHTSYVKKNKRK
jgi:hypothetical protein